MHVQGYTKLISHSKEEQALSLEESASVQAFLWQSQIKLFAFLTHMEREQISCERYRPRLPQAHDTLGRHMAVSRKAEDEPKFFLFFFKYIFIMQFNVCFLLFL